MSTSCPSTSSSSPTTPSANFRVVADQLSRASTSIVLNLAEGAGKFSKPDKRRFYLTAVGSTTESAAIFDVFLRLNLVNEEKHTQAKAMLERISAMLVKLAKAQEGD